MVLSFGFMVQKTGAAAFTLLPTRRRRLNIAGLQ
jgi:hypothetical protein